jgi:FixJ family two-component response regulator
MERLQKHDRLANVPVIVLTGRGKSKNLNRALQAGAVAFFQKPVEDGELLLAIWKALDTARGGVRFKD